MQSVRLLLKNYVMENARRGDIQNIINTINKFGWTKHRLMNISDQKGKILDQAIQTRKPKSVLELGTFIGYRSLRIITQLPKDALFVTIEPDSKSAEIARFIIEYAGVIDRIKLINDSSDNIIPRLSKDFNINSFDFIFIDHYKELYLRDFQMLENLGLIKSGTMIVADNVIYPGAPDYLDYIRNNPKYQTQTHDAKLEYRDNIYDGIEISIRK